MIKRILSILVWVLTAAGIAALLGFARYRYYSGAVSGINLTIVGQDDGSFLNYNNTLVQLNQITGVENKAPLRSVKIRHIKNELTANPFVADVSAYITIEGVVMYKLVERNPLLRIFTQKQQNFYIDHQGILFPVSSNHTERVIIANGYIPEVNFNNDKKHSVYDKAVAKELLAAYTISKVIEGDKLLHVMVDQIYFNSLNEIELIPKIGLANILLGDATDLEVKLRNVSGFYRAKAGSNEINQYSQINAKFRNQIVCIKRDMP